MPMNPVRLSVLASVTNFGPCRIELSTNAMKQNSSSFPSTQLRFLLPAFTPLNLFKYVVILPIDQAASCLPDYPVKDVSSQCLHMGECATGAPSTLFDSMALKVRLMKSQDVCGPH